jgi:hypothetical protein
MTTARATAQALAALLVLMTCAAPARAQGAIAGRLTMETVAAIATDTDQFDDPFLAFDAAATIRLGRGFDTVVRPYARRRPDGDWDAQFYQFQIRYQTATKIPLRVDAGIITSPIGLATLELRPDLNPTVAYPFYYFGSLPALDIFSDRLQLLSGGYPLGAVVSASGDRWDARVGTTDGTPARYRKIFQNDAVPSMLQFVAGGGVSPIAGLRFGAGFSNGPFRRAQDYFDDPDYYGGDPTIFRDATATVFNVEGEYAFHYTKLSGEWVRDRFDSTAGTIVSNGYYLQGVQTLTPRLWAAGRLVYVSSPLFVGYGHIDRTRASVETTGGYRLSNAFTVRAGYIGTRGFGSTDWNHVAAMSLVWAQRWF